MAPITKDIETGDVTGTADKDYNIIWFTEQCLSNALRLEVFIRDAERGGSARHQLTVKRPGIWVGPGTNDLLIPASCGPGRPARDEGQPGGKDPACLSSKRLHCQLYTHLPRASNADLLLAS